MTIPAAVRIAACALVALVLAAPAQAREPIAIDARAVPLDAGDGGRARVGALAWRGGLELRSADPRFGGLSGLVVAADGTAMIAITDAGNWVGARLDYDRRGRLAGLSDAWIAPLKDQAGVPLAGKTEGDAEDVTALPDGGYLVAFEQRHRLWRYADVEAAAAAYPAPDLGALPANGGIEALGALADGRVLALTEAYFIVPGGLAGWLIGGGQALTVIYPSDGYFEPTALSVLDDGRVLVLERGYSVALGVKGRLILLDQAFGPGARIAPQEIARFEPPVQVDNFEGLAVRRSGDGALLVYIASDDNFSPLQRTLLLMFALVE